MNPPEHRCIVCGDLFTRWQRPEGEVSFCGQWGDACPQCYTVFTDYDIQGADQLLLQLPGY